MGEYSNPDDANMQNKNWGGKAPAVPKDHTVVGTVDVLDRPIPNENPASDGDYSYEQPAYYRAPKYK